MLVDVENLHVFFDKKDEGLVKAVNGISFSIERGSRVGIVGASGSGKTRTALALLGLVQGTPGVVGGRVTIDGVNIYEGIEEHVSLDLEAGGYHWVKKQSDLLNAIKRQTRDIRGNNIGMIFQEPKQSLSPYYSIRAQFEETIKKLRGNLTPGEIDSIILPLLERVMFPEAYLTKYPHELSGGESQRMMIALALLGEPDLLIADEPTTSLDLVTQNQILDLLTQVIKEKEMALLMISHDLSVIAKTVDYLLVMENGQITDQGDIATILAMDNVHASRTTISLRDSTLALLHGVEQ